ncbi:nuclear transport factor 2 family protein [Streptomyces xanthophaeus]
MTRTIEDAAIHDDLLRRLRDLEDQDALRALLVHGWRALDRKDWRSWTDCWAEDAVLEFAPWGSIRGKEAIRRKVEEAESPYPGMQHHILNTHFTVKGDRATGVGYMWFVAVTRPGRTSAPYAMGGTYAWEFTRGAAGWLLTRQQLGLSWTQGDDAVRAFDGDGH